jgi:hypothetical protein
LENAGFKTAVPKRITSSVVGARVLIESYEIED